MTYSNNMPFRCYFQGLVNLKNVSTPSLQKTSHRSFRRGHRQPIEPSRTHRRRVSHFPQSLCRPRRRGHPLRILSLPQSLFSRTYGSVSAFLRSCRGQLCGLPVAFLIRLFRLFLPPWMISTYARMELLRHF